MKQPVPIPVSVALSDKEYCYPSWMRFQSIASPSPPPPLTCALQHFTDSLPALIYTPEGGEGGGGRRKMSDTLWELSVFPKDTTE